ncbi:MAG: hypothetical protein BGO54_13850 [Sphingobacteriales bacterium 46-32]|nr:MAG: hypothetical protein BGO54_13850 [Sphingobacteriales bacterium 46-32]
MENSKETVATLFASLHPLRTQDGCYYSFKRICESIENLLREQHDQETDPGTKTHYLHAFSALTHTIGKEVWFIKAAQDKMRKKGAARIRATEYEQAVEKAYWQVKMDIASFL